MGDREVEELGCDDMGLAASLGRSGSAAGLVVSLWGGRAARLGYFCPMDPTPFGRHREHPLQPNPEPIEVLAAAPAPQVSEFPNSWSAFPGHTSAAGCVCKLMALTADPCLFWGVHEHGWWGQRWWEEEGGSCAVAGGLEMSSPLGFGGPACRDCVVALG